MLTNITINILYLLKHIILVNLLYLHGNGVEDVNKLQTYSHIFLRNVLQILKRSL